MFWFFKFWLHIYICNQYMTKYFETAQKGLQDSSQSSHFIFSIRKLGREAFPSLHISVSLRDANIQRTLHGNFCNLGKFWLLSTG